MKIKTYLAALLAVIGLLGFSGCKTTSTTTSTGGTNTVVVIHQFDSQGTADAAAIAVGILSNPVVSNAIYQAIQPK